MRLGLAGKSLATTQVVSQAKGALGEQRVAKALVEQGVQCIHTGGAVKRALDGTRYFSADLLCWRHGKAFWVQVKHKEPREKYGDTGLERWRLENLRRLEEQSGLPVLLLFTDSTGEVYGGWVASLPESPGHGNTYNSQTGDAMVYWWLHELRFLDELVALLP